MAKIALFAIARKRRQIVRRIAAGDGDARALKRAVAHLDAAARLLSEPRPPKRQRSRKPVVWPIKQALNQARSLTARELTARVCAVRGDDANAAMHTRVFDALYDLKRRGIVCAVGKPLRWRLTSPTVANSPPIGGSPGAPQRRL